MLTGNMKNGAIHLQINTDSLVASKAKELAETAKKILGESPDIPKVVLDMSKVTIIDSIGITFIIALLKSTISNGKKLKVTGVNEDITQLFKLMNLDEVLDIENS